MKVQEEASRKGDGLRSGEDDGERRIDGRRRFIG